MKRSWTMGIGLACVLGSSGCTFSETVAPLEHDPGAPYPLTGVTRTFELTIEEHVPWEVGLGAIYDATTYNGTVPGPTIDVNAGDHVVVRLTNNGSEPYSVHTHVSEFSEDDDGAGMSLTMPGETREYAWDAVFAGTFPYHDHGMGPEGGTGEGEGMTRGLIGAVVVRAPDEQPAEEHVVVLADFDTSAYLSLPGVADPETGEFPEGVYHGGHQYMHTINGKAYPEAIPAFEGTVGALSRWRVVSIGREFHTWHIHGHRWLGEGGVLTDNVVLGPGMYTTFEFLEDAPGTWPVHCHVPDHMAGGMITNYVVR